jgi:hypothetical protein
MGPAGGTAVYEGLLDAEHLSLDGLPESGTHEQVLTEGGELRLVMSVQAQTSAGRKRCSRRPGTVAPRPVQAELTIPNGPRSPAAGNWRAQARAPFGLRR